MFGRYSIIHVEAPICQRGIPCWIVQGKVPRLDLPYGKPLFNCLSYHTLQSTFIDSVDLFRYKFVVCILCGDMSKHMFREESTIDRTKK